MSEFTWKIESVDQVTSSMVVSFEHDGKISSYNIPTPKAGEDVQTHVTKYAPVKEWAVAQLDIANDLQGQSGSVVFEKAASDDYPSDIPNVAGNVNEEYLRALIYQVLEEIKESTV